MEVLLGLIAGALGGNISARVRKNLDQGALITTVVGTVGGGLGATILTRMGVPDGAGAGGLDFAMIIGQVAGGALGGVAMLALFGLIRNTLG